MGFYKYLAQEEEISSCSIALGTLKLTPKLKLLVKIGCVCVCVCAFFLQQLQKDNLAKLKS